MKLINSTTNKEVKIGDTVTSFRGERFELRSWSEPHHEGSTGRIYVREGKLEGSYYPSVFDCKFVN